MGRRQGEGYDASTTEHGGSYVKVNRLKDSWTWNVQVAAIDNTPERLREAKLTALQIAYELRDELQVVEESEEAALGEVPF